LTLDICGLFIYLFSVNIIFNENTTIVPFRGLLLCLFAFFDGIGDDTDLYSMCFWQPFYSNANLKQSKGFYLLTRSKVGKNTLTKFETKLFGKKTRKKCLRKTRLCQ
jgi:hypothetical protein